MGFSRRLLKAARDYLRQNPPLGITSQEIDAIPGGKAPPWMGQRFLVVYANGIRAVGPSQDQRQYQAEFSIAVIRRVRDLPRDRVSGAAWLDLDSMSQAIEDCILKIESKEFFDYFKSELDNEKIPPDLVVGGYDPDSPPAGLPSRYNLHQSAFIFMHANTEGSVMYPSDFLAYQEDVDPMRPSGFKMDCLFQSPVYSETWNHVLCERYTI